MSESGINAALHEDPGLMDCGDIEFIRFFATFLVGDVVDDASQQPLGLVQAAEG